MREKKKEEKGEEGVRRESILLGGRGGGKLGNEDDGTERCIRELARSDGWLIRPLGSVLGDRLQLGGTRGICKKSIVYWQLVERRVGVDSTC